MKYIFLFLLIFSACEQEPVMDGEGSEVTSLPDRKLDLSQRCVHLPDGAEFLEGDGRTEEISDPTAVHSYSNTDKHCEFRCPTRHDWDGETCAPTSELVGLFPNGNIIYKKDKYDNRLPDYSIAGYRGGGKIIPQIESKIVVQPFNDDKDTDRIQQAIDEVAKLPLKDGFRGAVHLQPGTFKITKQLELHSSGIVLRGSGTQTVLKDVRKENQATTLRIGPPKATLKSPHNGQSIANITFPRKLVLAKAVDVTPEPDEYRPVTTSYPVGSLNIYVSDTSKMVEGDRIYMEITPSEKWIQDLGAQNFGWTYQVNQYGTPYLNPNIRLRWEKVITKVDRDKNLISFDSPIQSILRKEHISRSQIFQINEDPTSRIYNVGAEDLVFVSDYDPSKTYTVPNENNTAEPFSLRYSGPWFTDEEHPKNAIIHENVRNFWIRRSFAFFYWYSFSVSLGDFVNQGTLEDLAFIDPVSKNNYRFHQGARAYSFNANGKRLLYQRLYSRHGRHAFIANGPHSEIAFLDCVSEFGHIGSEPHQAFTQALLFDNIYSDSMIKLNQSQVPHGHRAVSSTVWNSEASSYRSWEPQLHIDDAKNNTGYNYAVGVKISGLGLGLASPSPEAKLMDGSFNSNQSYIESTNNYVLPRSLYLSQLNARLGWTAVEKVTVPLQRQTKAMDGITKYLKEVFDDIPKYQSPNQIDKWLPQKDYWDYPLKTKAQPVIDEDAL